VRVTVWRHGEAGSAASDHERALTDRGRRELLIQAKEFATRSCAAGAQKPVAIHHSPWLRTTQTAGVLAGILAIPAAAFAGLAPGSTLADVDPALDSAERHIVLVSHQPLVSELLWFWLDSNDLPPLAPGGWATVDVIAHARGAADLLDACAVP
jgi:phosphohistidine phosphatase SixA